MRRLWWLALVAWAAYVSGRRQGQVEGYVRGSGMATRAFIAGSRS